MPKGVYARASPAERLLASVQIGPDRGLGPCHVSAFAPDKDGYAALKANGRNVRAHRAAWVMFVGPIPAGLLVLHRCDNPPCVRLDHLFLGSPLSNMEDKMAKGRHVVVAPTGLANGKAKVSDAAVLAIRAAHAAGQTYKSIGSDYGLCRQWVGQICRNEVRSHASIS